MTTQTAARTTINATVTEYEGEDPVLWAEHVAEQLAELHPGADINVTYGRENAAWLGREPMADFADLCTGWWEDLCAQPNHPAWSGGAPTVEGCTTMNTQPATEPTQDDTCIYVLSVEADGETATADVRVVVPKYKLIASCDGDADGPVLDMLIAHGLPADEDALGLLGDGEREGDASGYIERTEDGWELWRRDGSETAEGGVTLMANEGRPTVARQHPYDTCGSPLDVCFEDSILRAIARGHGRGSDDAKDIIATIVHCVDKAARG